MPITRRHWLGSATAAASVFAVGSGGAEEKSRPPSGFVPMAEDSRGQSWLQKLIYASADAQVTWLMTGIKYARSGSQLTPLWRTHTVAFHDVVKEASGVRLRSLEIPFALELEADRQLSDWINPISGERVRVPAFDPATISKFHHRFAAHQREARPGLFLAERYSEPEEIGPTLWFNGEKHVEVRGVDGAVSFEGFETLRYSALASELKSLTNTRVSGNLTLNIFSSWLPWMNLSGHDGGLFTLASGSKLTAAAPLPELTQRLLAHHHPEIAEDPFRAMGDTAPP